MNTLKFRYHDGGRVDAGYRGEARDCVARAVAIASGSPYKEVYATLAEGNASQKVRGTEKRRPKSARNGIVTKSPWFHDYMTKLGFTWYPTMKVGQGCTTKLNAGDLPSGSLVVKVTKHVAAVIDGRLMDTHDCSRNGTRCVYGYWKKDE